MRLGAPANNIKQYCIFFSIIICIFFLNGCDSDNNNTIIDRIGNSVKLPQKREKIISTTPSITEIIVGLGKANRLCAIDKYSVNIPNVPSGLPQFDSFFPDAEKILSYQPDVIIVNMFNDSGTASNQFSYLQNFGIAVVYLPVSKNIQDIYDDITFIARLLEEEERGEELIKIMQNEIENIQFIGRAIKNKKKVYFEISPVPEMVTLGAGTYLNELIELCGAENIFIEENGVVFPNAEEIIIRNPDVILTNVTYIDNPQKEVTERVGFNYINAVKNHEVYTIDANSSSRPSQNIICAISCKA